MRYDFSQPKINELMTHLCTGAINRSAVRLLGKKLAIFLAKDGWLDARLVVLVWTPRGEARRIISMRKGNDREKALYARHLERS